MTADINTFFCTAQNVFSTDSVVYSTDWLDWKIVQDNGAGEEPEVEIIVTTSFAGGTSVRFQLMAVADAGGAGSGGTAAVMIAQSREYLAAEYATQLVAPTAVVAPVIVGSVVRLKISALTALPASTQKNLQLRVQCVGAVSAGAITAHLKNRAASSAPGKAYASGY